MLTSNAKIRWWPGSENKLTKRNFKCGVNIFLSRSRWATLYSKAHLQEVLLPEYGVPVHVGDIAKRDEFEHVLGDRVAVALQFCDAVLHFGGDHPDALLREDDAVDEVPQPLDPAGELVPLEGEAHGDVLREPRESDAC